MRNKTCILAALVFVMCVGRASADADRLVQAFERMGAVIKKDDTKLNRPVIALIFGLRSPIPDTVPELDKDNLLYGFLPDRDVIKVTGTPRKDGDKPLDQPSPTAIKVADADLKDVSKLDNLQVLDLSYSEITNEALQYIKELKNLQILDLRNTKVNDAGLQLLQERKNLKKLYLTNCPVTDDGLAHLRGLNNLESLFLGGTNVTGKGMRHLKELKNLQKLHLQFTKVKDAGLKELRNLTNLRELTLQDNQYVTDTALETIKEYAELKVLSLDHTKVTDEGLKHLSGLKQLELLDLCLTKVTDEGTNSLRELANLRRLSLCHTKLTDRGLKQLKTLKKLERLDLERTQVTTAGEKEIKEALPKLEIGSIHQIPTWAKIYWQQKWQQALLQGLRESPTQKIMELTRRFKESEQPARAPTMDQADSDKLAIGLLIAVSLAGCLAVVLLMWMVSTLFMETEGKNAVRRMFITSWKLLGFMGLGAVLVLVVGALVFIEKLFNYYLFR